MAIVYLISLAVWAGLVYATYSVAKSKGREPTPWIIFAIVLPLIALIVVAVMPPKGAA